MNISELGKIDVSNGCTPQNMSVLITDKSKIEKFNVLINYIASRIGGIEKAKKYIPLACSTYDNIKHHRKISVDVGNRILLRYKHLKNLEKK